MTARRRGKRGNREGAIYADADGRWRSVVDLGRQDGKRQRKYLPRRTPAEVAQKLRAALEGRDASRDLPPAGSMATPSSARSPLR